jgi:hypothetical protein
LKHTVNLHVASFAREPADAGNCQRLPLPSSCPLLFQRRIEVYQQLTPDLFSARVRATSKHFIERFAVIGPFKAENSEIYRCYFGVPVSRKRGILWTAGHPSLFFGANNSENSGGAPDLPMGAAAPCGCQLISP